MKSLRNITLSIALCGAVQACSSSSDPLTSGAATQMPVGQTGGQTSGQSGNGNGNGTVSGTTTSYDPVNPQLVADSASVVCEAPTADFQSTMLAVVNESRLSARMCGDSSHAAVGLVTWNDQLTVAANAHAQDMVTHNFFNHDGSDGLSVSNRAEAAGYNWRAVGENIAAGQLDIAEAHQGWLDSEGHCRNIMNPLYTEIGAACIDSSSNNYGSYWVVVFGDQLPGTN